MKNFRPTNPLVGAMLTDLYQLTMAYGYWKAGRHEEHAVFDLFFRKFPFDGNFAIGAGLEELLRLANTFKFKRKDIRFIKKLMPEADEEFFLWLETVNCRNVKIFAADEGSLILPYAPFIHVEGPLAVVQILETVFLNLVNFSSLIATKAARIRLAAGFKKTLVEFGLRRSQGPDGGLSASRYSYIGGFDGTSNVLAGKIFDIPVKGTMAHSFIQSFANLKDLKNHSLTNAGMATFAFVDMALKIREELGFTTNEGELAAFIAYAQAFPNNFLALVDSYSTLESGVPNFISVALALQKIGFKPVGIRIDSGELASLSRKIREMFGAVAREQNTPWLKNVTIFASDEIDEEKILTMRKAGDEIDGFGIGTRLVTCQPTPALGGVYKLTEVEVIRPVIKISEEEAKVTFPAAKEVYRIYDRYANAIGDLVTLVGEKVAEKEKFVAVNIATEKRVALIPSKVTPLLKLVWDGKLVVKLPTIHEIRNGVLERLKNRSSFEKNRQEVYASERLWELRRELLKENLPLPEIR